jgi:CBS domain-containing protein
MDKNIDFDYSEITKKLVLMDLFDKIPEERLEKVIKNTSVIEIKQNDILFNEGDNYHKGVYIILKGAIALENDRIEKTILKPGDVVGLTTFVGKSAYSVTATAEDDSTLIYLPEICVYKLMADYEHFRKFFYNLTVERLKVTSTQDEKLSLSTYTYKSVQSHMTSPIITFHEDSLVTEASKLMSNHKIGALVITNDNKKLKGILTTKHIVHKFIPMIEEKGLDIKAKEIMDTYPVTVPKDYPLIEALAEMQSKNKDYAIVVKHFNPIGIISNKDIMKAIYQTASTMSFHVEHTKDISELAIAKRNLYKVAKNLVNNSRLTSEVLQTISSLHLRIQKQVFQIAIEKYKEQTGFDPKNVDYCVIIMGSGARREMMLDPDQDNGFIFGNNITKEEKQHLMEIGKLFSDYLEEVGYEKCPGNIMVTNPEMSKTLIEWQESVYTMIHNPGNEGLLKSSIIFDLEGFHGNESLVWELKSFILESASKNDVFLLQLFEMEAKHTIPISFFGKFITIKEGKHKGMIDLKVSALSFIVFIARLLTLKNKINDVNTIDRLNHLKRIKALDDTTVGNILSSYEVIADILFRNQIKQAENNEELTKVIDPKKLSMFNQHKLKEALTEIQKLVSLARRKFKGM